MKKVYIPDTIGMKSDGSGVLSVFRVPGVLTTDRRESNEKKTIHAHRTAGRHRHHLDPGGDASAGTGKDQRNSQQTFLQFPAEDNDQRDHSVCGFELGLHPAGDPLQFMAGIEFLVVGPHADHQSEFPCQKLQCPHDGSL